MKAYLNLGCGIHFHPAWTNISFVSAAREVIAHDVRKGIPFPDRSFKVVYHSHLLEHLPRGSAEPFLLECHRVLDIGGVLRVVVPDLEQIVRTYLKTLEQARAGHQESAANYEWMMLEIYDQTVRDRSGGDMARYLKREDLQNEKFVVERLGLEARNLIEAGRKRRQDPGCAALTSIARKGLIDRMKQRLRLPFYARERLIRMLLGEEYNVLRIGRFRQGGEVHQWMYDSYSLALLLQKCGFQQVVQRTATESYIPQWRTFHLDTEPDGNVYKPDSLFMEGIKGPS